MRIEIASQDRVGITQEILSVFAAKQWNLLAVEVSKFHTFVQLKDKGLSLATIKPALLKISGVEAAKAIELMPGERKSQQLEVLLAKIPEPIIDIDKNGLILVANKAAADFLKISSSDLIGKSIKGYIEQRLKMDLTGQSSTQEVTFAGHQFFADISPVKTEHTISGAVLVLRSLENVGRHLSQLQQGIQSGFDSIVGKSSKMVEVINQAKRFSNLDLPILISGETGTGKELIARALHDTGNRANKPFLAINCAALPEHLLESELFGYAAGAFTGAKRGGKPGLLELADGGSVFLDEIAEMPTYLQAKLLRFLQDFQLRRVGAVKDKKVDVRIISASHQNLPKLVTEKHFREDLYYRLNVLNLNLPPLRDRQDDIPLLVDVFIDNAAKQVNQINISMSATAMQKICQYSWPGNIRQLQNVLFRVVALADANIITEQQLVFDDDTLHKGQMTSGHGAPISNEQVTDWQSAQQQFEQELLTSLYPLYPSTRKLAERLNVSHNKVAMKIRQYGIKTK